MRTYNQQSMLLWKRLAWAVGVLAGLVLVLTLTVFARQAKAVSAPSVITYQGKILENSISVTTTKAVKFVLYDAATGGNIKYTAGGSLVAPSAVNITPTNGIFTVNLGGAGTNALDPDIFKDNTNIYLEVTVGSEVLSPRKQLTAYPYAFNSNYASTSSYANNANFSNSANYANTASTATYAYNTGVANTATYANNSGLFEGLATSSFAKTFFNETISGVWNFINDVFFSSATITSSTIGTANVGNLRVTGNSVGLQLSDITGSSTLVYNNLAYSNPTWISSLSADKIAGTVTSSLLANTSTYAYNAGTSSYSWLASTSSYANYANTSTHALTSTYSYNSDRLDNYHSSDFLASSTMASGVANRVAYYSADGRNIGYSNAIIISGAQVGINTTALDSNSALTVSGNIFAQNSVGAQLRWNSAGLMVKSTGGTKPVLDFNSGTNEFDFRIQQIGTRGLEFLSGPSSTNQISRIKIDDSGHVGINNSAPSSTLDVSGDINLTGALKINNNNVSQYFITATGSAGYVLRMNASSTGYEWYQIPTAASGNGVADGNVGYFSYYKQINFGDTTSSLVVSSNDLYYDSANGRVGVGNSSPSVKFDVTGAGKFSSDLTVGGNLAVTGNINSGSVTSSGNIYTSGNLTGSNLYLSTGGGITIGSTKYSDYFIDSGSASGKFWVSNGVGSRGQWTTFAPVGYGSAGQLAYYSANGTVVTGTSAIFINGSNVGIGTTTAASKLTVSGDINLTGNLLINGRNYSQYFINATGTEGYVWRASSTGFGYWSPASGGSGGSVSTSTAGYVAVYSDIDGDISTTVTGTNAMIIDNAGRVMIGTTTPYYATSTATTSTLTVRGALYADHIYTSGNSFYMNGQKIIGTNSTDLNFYADSGQNMKVQAINGSLQMFTTGNGNVELRTDNNGDIRLISTNNLSMYSTGTMNIGTKNSSALNMFTTNNNLTITAGGTGNNLRLIGSNIYLTGRLYDAESSVGSVGQFLQTTATGTRWATPDGSGTVNSGGNGNVAYYAATGTVVMGNNSMFINSSTGFVGIQNNNPTVPLSVGPNPTTAYNANELLQLSKTGDAYMTIYDGTSRFLLGSTAGTAFLGTQNDTPFTIRVNNNPRVYFTGSSYSYAVGVGASTPLSKLSVYGNAAIGSGYANSYAAPTDGLLVQGSVGIGTTSPNYKLSVVGDINATGTYYMNGKNYGQYFIDDSGATNQVWTSNGSGRGQWLDISALPIAGAVATSTQGYLAYYDSDGANVTGTPAIFVSSTYGLIGVGTVVPSYRLHVVGGDNAMSGPVLTLAGSSQNQVESGRVRFTEDTTYQGAFISYNGSTNIFNIGVHDTTDNSTANDYNSISIKRLTGYVGIGTTTPAYPLTVSGNMNLTGNLYLNGTNYSQWFINSGTTTANLVWASDGTGTHGKWANISDIYTAPSSSVSGNPAGSDGQVQFNNSGVFGASANLTWDNANGKLTAVNTFIAKRSTDNSRVVIKGDTGYDAVSEYWGTDPYPRWAIGRDGISAGAPAITFNYGMAASVGSYTQYGSAVGQPATSTLAFYTTTGAASSLTERMRIASDGKVGIGTTTPAYKLDIYGGGFNVNGGSDIGVFRIGGTGNGAQYSAFGLYNNNDNHTFGQSYRQVAGNAHGLLYYFNNGSTYVNIMNLRENGDINLGGNLNENTGDGAYVNIIGGKVGIGTTNPTSTLSVLAAASTGNIFQVGTTTNQNILSVGANGTVSILSPLANPPSYPYNLLISDTASYATGVGGGLAFGGKYDSTGNLGGFAAIKGGKENSTSGNYDGYLSFYSRPNGSALTERMRITSNGNVGIGTTSPAYPLTVSGTAWINDDIYFLYRPSLYGNLAAGSYGIDKALLRLGNQNNFGSNSISFGTADNRVFELDAYSATDLLFRASDKATLNFRGSAYEFYTSVDGYVNPKLVVDNSGNVGIGTSTPAASLSIYDSSNAGITLYRTRSSNFQQNASGGALALARESDGLTNVQLRAYGDSYLNALVGNVGIGTTTPNVKLEISDSSNAGFRTTYTSNTGLGEWTAYEGSAYKGGLSMFGSNYATTLWRNALLVTAATDNTGSFIVRTKTGGVYNERFVIANNGNVGIGTTSPAYPLTVSGTAYISQDLRIAGDAYLSGALYDSTGSFGSSNNILISTGTSTKWVSTTTLGLVAGSGYSSVGSAGYIQFASSTSGAFDSTSGLYWDNTNGRLGIGTNSPSSSLHVIGNINQTRSVNDQFMYGFTFKKDRAGTVVQSGDALGYFDFYGYSGSSYVTAAQVQTEVDGTASASSMPGRLIFSTTQANSTSLSERMRITNNGNVGIGTSTPDSLLTIKSNGGNRAFSVYTSSTTSNDPFVIADNGYLEDSGSAIKPAFLFDTSLYALHIQGHNGSPGQMTLSVASSSYSANDILGRIAFKPIYGYDYAYGLIDGRYEKNGYGALVFSTLKNFAGSERMRITSEGNVGIGTTNPTSTLSVLAATSTGNIFQVGTTTAPNILTVMANGYVGINSSSPSAPFVVQGSIFNMGYFKRASSGGAGFTLENGDGVAMNFGESGGTTQNFFAGLNGGADNFFYVMGSSSGYMSLKSDAKIGWTSSLTSAVSSPDTYFYRQNSGVIRTPGNLLVDGNVGIGTSAPNAALTVNGSYSQNNHFTIKTFGVNNVVQYTNYRPDVVSLYDTSKPVSAFTQGGDQFTFYSAPATAGSPVFAKLMTISTSSLYISNKVGIGTTSPSYPLTVSGTAYISQDLKIAGDTYLSGALYDSTGVAGGNNYVLMSTGTSTKWISTTTLGLVSGGATPPAGSNGQVQFNDSGVFGATSSLYWDNTSGNLGIGTATPAYALHVSRSLAASSLSSVIENTSANGSSFTFVGLYNDTGFSGRAGVLRNSSANSSYAGIGSLNMFNIASNPIGFVTNNTLRAIITGSGNVGIGTANPTSTLSVLANVSTGSIFQVGTTTAQNILTVGANGYVGIGTSTPNYALHVVGYDATGNGVSAVVENTAHTTNAYAVFGMRASSTLYGQFFGGAAIPQYGIVNGITMSPGSSTQDIGFRTGNALLGTASGATMIIKSNGNVGIGTSTPDATLTATTTTGAAGVKLFNFTASEGGGLTLTDNATSGFLPALVGQSYGVSGYGFNINGIMRTANDVATPAGGGIIMRAYRNDGTNNTALENSNVFSLNNYLTNVMTVSADGYVGIGTNTPAGPLHTARSADYNGTYLDDYSTTDSHGTFIYMRKSGSNTIGGHAATVDGEVLGDVRFWGDSGTAFTSGASINAVQNGAAGTYTPTDLKFVTTNGTNSLERMRITKDGYVGIGTSTPNGPFEVVFDDSTGGVTGLHVRNTNSGANAYSGVYYFDNNNIASVFNGFNNSTHEYRFNNMATNGAINFLLSGASKLAIATNGYIGIGTTSPAYPLTVSGTIQATGLTANGTVYSNNGVLTNTDPSDVNLKYDILDLNSSLVKITNLRPVSFKWKNNNVLSHGFIAQEVEQILPELVSVNADGTKGLYTTQFIPYIVKAIQEQQSEIESFQSLNSSMAIGSSTTSTDLTVAGNLRVIKNVEVKGHIYFSDDSIGKAKILAGADTAHVTFVENYSNPPIVTISPLDFVGAEYRVGTTTVSGFDIALSTSTTHDVSFNWHAFTTNKLKIHISDGNIEIVYDTDNKLTGTTATSTLPSYVNPNNTDPSWGPVGGCTNPLADNYNPNATDDDGSCIVTSGSVVSSDNMTTNTTVSNIDSTSVTESSTLSVDISTSTQG